MYQGPLDCAKKLYRAHGIKGIFQGQVPTVWRDGVGYGYVVGPAQLCRSSEFIVLMALPASDPTSQHTRLPSNTYAKPRISPVTKSLLSGP